MVRILAVFFIVAGATRAYYDWQLSRLNEEPFAFLPVGQVWFNFDQNSLQLVQAGVERYLSPVIWENLIRPITFAPMAPALFWVGAFFAAIAIWRMVRKAMA